MEGRVLVVGDGDLSFAAALAAARPLGGRGLVASTLEARKALVAYYSTAAAHIEALEAAGAEVRHEVDATALREVTPPLGRAWTRAEGCFDRIVFNFPHILGKNKIRPNRLLVQKFLAEASALVACGGEVHVTLCKGQGGTPVDTDRRKWADHWQVVPAAAAAGMVLVAVRPFSADCWPGYNPRREVGNRGQDRYFTVDLALTHIFMRYEPAASLRELFLKPDPMVSVRDKLCAALTDHFSCGMQTLEADSALCADADDSTETTLAGAFGLYEDDLFGSAREAAAGTLRTVDNVVHFPASSSVGPDVPACAYQLLAAYAQPRGGKSPVAELKIDQLIANALGLTGVSLVEAPLSRTREAAAGDSAACATDGVRKFQQVFHGECYGGQWDSAYARVQVHRHSATVAGGEDNPTSCSGWASADQLTAAALFTSRSHPERAVVMLDLEVCTMAACGFLDRRYLASYRMQQARSLIYPRSLWPVTYRFDLLFAGDIPSSAVARAIREVCEDRVFLAEEGPPANGDAAQAPGVRCFQLWLNSATEPLVYEEAYALFQRTRFRVREKGAELR